MTDTNWSIWRNKKIKQFEHELGKTSIISKLLDSLDGYNYHICIGNFFINVNELTRETTIFNIKTKKVATAKCSIYDSFMLIDGVAIAWAKYTDSHIPIREETICREALENGNTFYRPSIDKHETYIFIGWIPNTSIGTMGKWSLVLENGSKVIKMQIPEVVNRL